MSLSLVRRSSKTTTDTLRKSANLQEALLHEANQQVEDAHELVRTTSFDLKKKQELLKDAEEKKRAAEEEAARAEAEAQLAETEVHEAELRKATAAASIQKVARGKKARDDAKAKQSFESKLPWFETEQEKAEKERVAAARKKAAESIQRAAAKRAAAKQVATEAAEAAAAAEEAAAVVEEALARAQAAETLQNWQHRQLKVAQLKRFFAQHERTLQLVLCALLVVALVAATGAWERVAQPVATHEESKQLVKKNVGKVVVRAAGRLLKRLLHIG